MHDLKAASAAFQSFRNWAFGAAALAVVFALGNLLGACSSTSTTMAGPPKVPKVESDKTVGGFKWPESVVYNKAANVLYVSEFGSKLAPDLKDGAGYIMKVGLDGKVIEEHFLPLPGVTMNKPKGLWVADGHLWVTDIDGVWEFDLGTKQGKKMMLPGATFANDPMVMNGVLYVTDNRSDILFSVSPANFLEAADAKAEVEWHGKGVNPNGIYPGRDGSILLAGFLSDKEKRALYSQMPSYDPKPLGAPIGRLDGLYQAADGLVIFTNWDTGSLDYLDAANTPQILASGFKGPADLCAFPNDGGLMVVVPDLVQSQLRFIQLSLH